MTTGGMRRTLAAVTVVLGAVAGPAFASTATDNPQPCAVTYSATPHGAGNPITTTFGVSCTEEVTSIEQQTTLSDTAPTGRTAACHQQVVGTAATQVCSITGVALHTYAVTFRLEARGNYAVCLDDGACDSLTPVEDPACVRTAAAPHPSVEAASVVLDCTYRQLVTVGGG